ncbi:MAG: TRZ/ATZ family hydrolase [Chromatiales bacterium]|nr:TRZ/ATZ family hydrolase [Chromatiales bacterium]
MQVETLIVPRWVVPVEPAGTLDQHCVAVDEGRIVAVVPAAEAPQFEARERVALPGHALLPGFVNAHTHAAMSLLRGLADDLPLKAWLEQHIWPAEARWIGEGFVRDGVRLAAAEMLRGGTTCFNDMYFFGDIAAHEAQALGIRAVMGLIVIEFPSAWAADVDGYFTRAAQMHDACRGYPLVTTAFAPHAPYSVPDDALRRVKVQADELDIPVHMHLHEAASEIAGSLEHFGLRPLARLDALGLLGPPLLAVHMTQLEAGEIERVAAAGVHVVHCPESNLKLASGLCPVAALLDAGVNVALGTDGAASNNDLDMLGELRTAALLAKGVAGDPAVLPAAAALHMATLAGARALGLGEEIGSIVAGKQADLLAIDLGGVATSPVYDPVSQIVYAASRDQVTDVWVAGRRRLAAGQFVDIDADTFVSAAEHWRERIAAADRG